MRWAKDIDHNTHALTGILTMLFAMVGLVDKTALQRISRELHLAVMRVLRPAESATRRLIVLAAQERVAKPAPLQSVTPHPKHVRPKNSSERGGPRYIFKLYDARKSFKPRRRGLPSGIGPQIRVVSFDPRIPLLALQSKPDAPSLHDGKVNALPLNRRLFALKSALANIPHQAQRLLRWQARREHQRDHDQRPIFTTPLRPGRPPGYRQRPCHEVDDILNDCHGLARLALMPDTS
jgi:hypothetical protein